MGGMKIASWNVNSLNVRLPHLEEWLRVAQPDVVAFGALGFLDMAVAHLDALRDAAHRDRVGGVRARALCGLDEALGQRRQGRLIEQAGCGGLRRKLRSNRW